MPRGLDVECSRRPPKYDTYLVRSIVRASEILLAFQNSGECLRLRDVVQRTGLGKGQCFRLLYTLWHCGLIEKVENNRYRLTNEIGRRKKYRIGYAAQGQDSSFAREVQTGLVRAAERERVELIVVDNRYQPKVALKNAELLIRDGVDLVIEFQTDEAVAPAIAAKYRQANIPMIAIDIPHPGATYFGANNYEAGLLAGRHLARWAQQRWNGQVDEIAAAGAGARRASSRGAGARRAGGHSRSRCPKPPAGTSSRSTATDSSRRRSSACADICGSRRRSGFSSALPTIRARLGAARAFQEAGRADGCAIVGQNAEPDARAELREPRTPLVASVGYFPEKVRRPD